MEWIETHQKDFTYLGESYGRCRGGSGNAFELMKNPELTRKARDEFKTRRAASNYILPIPDGLKPPLNLIAEERGKATCADTSATHKPALQARRWP